MRVLTRTSMSDWQTNGYESPPSGPASQYQEFFERYLPKRTDWSVLEIGACPGSYLLAICRSHGYHPVALDYLPAVQQLPKYFARFGVNDLEVIEHDFLTFETGRKFNVVTSYGFIEHFNDSEDIIRRHWALVADGGFLVLGAPVFGPMQMALRRLVLKPEKLEWTLGAHNRAIMNLGAITGICCRFPDARIELARYCGHMDSWFTPRDPFVRPSRAWLTLVWHAIGRVPRWLNWSSWQFSPTCLVIARRNGGQLS